MTEKTLTIFDPTMCCSTGVCGPDVDQELLRFSADVEWLRTRGVNVERFNLAQEPGAFVDDRDAKALLDDGGEAALPLFKIDGAIIHNGEYPTRQILAGWLGVVAPKDAPDTETKSAGGCCGPSEKEEAAKESSSSGCCGPSETEEAAEKSSSSGCC